MLEGRCLGQVVCINPSSGEGTKEAAKRQRRGKVELVSMPLPSPIKLPFLASLCPEQPAKNFFPHDNICGRELSSVVGGLSVQKLLVVGGLSELC